MAYVTWKASIPRLFDRSLIKSLAASMVALLFLITIDPIEVHAIKAADSPPAAGHIIGNIDGVSQDGDHYFISGWACQQGQARSIAVHVYGEDPKDAKKRDLLIVQFANLYSDTAVNDACQDSGGGRHRFIIMLPHGYGPESKVYVHGIRIVDGVSNDAIAGSGLKLQRLWTLETPHAPLPPITGEYKSSKDHPRVFMTPVELKDLAARINQKDSYSSRRFVLLADKVKADLTSGMDWSVTYSGCDGGVYLYTYSYEPQDGHEAEVRAQLKIAAGAKQPMGGAVVSARLALYAALIKAGATPPSGAPSADAAAALAKRILMAWADHGFPRDSQGRMLPLVWSGCGATAHPPTMVDPREIGFLHVARGVMYSVQAQDMLQSFGYLDASEESRANAFHLGMFEVVRQGSNATMGSAVFPYPDGARYGNPSANTLAAMLSTARLLDDGRRIEAVLFGTDHEIPVLYSWITTFNRLIYGQNDKLPEIGDNKYPDSLTSLQNHADFQNHTPVAGEIADRGRNATPLQGIGYPMFTLERLFNVAEVLRLSGYDAYGYRGVHNQSLEMAMQYYACFAKSAGYVKVVTAENSGFCPNAAQYYGKLVNGVDRQVVFAAWRFPGNKAITQVEPDAKTVSSSGVFSCDALQFGKWRD